VAEKNKCLDCMMQLRSMDGTPKSPPKYWRQSDDTGCGKPKNVSCKTVIASHLWYRYGNAREAAKEMGCSYDTFNLYMQDRYLLPPPLRRGPPYTHAEKRLLYKHIRQLHKDHPHPRYDHTVKGYGATKLARLFCFSRQLIHRILRTGGIGAQSTV
jgi:hypothetical protein